MSRNRVFRSAALLVCLFGSSPAHADAIDGDWCYSDGRSFTIRGPQIRTPGGTDTLGDYDRHAFQFVAPEGDRDAGTRFNMTLMNDDELQLRTTPPGASEQPLELWRRCKVTS